MADFSDLKSRLNVATAAAVDTWLAGQPQDVPQPAPAITPAPIPVAPVPAPAAAPQSGDFSAAGLNAQIAALSQAGGGVIRIDQAGTYPLDATVTLRSHVALDCAPGVVFEWRGDNQGPIFDTPADDCLVGVRASLTVDEGLTFAGDVFRLRSGSLNELRLLGLGHSSASTFLHIRPDSSGGEVHQGDRNFVANEVTARHMGQCGTFARIEGVPNGFGGQPQVVTLNEFKNWFGANVVSRGVTIPAWADNNVCTGAHRFSITGQGAIGVAVNEQNPTVETGVYAWTWQALAVDTWGAVPGGSMGRTGVFIGASKVMQCEMFHQQPPAEAGALRLAPQAISVYWRGRPGNANAIEIDERGVSAVNE